MKTVQGGLCAPKGFRASGVRAGIKPTSDKYDCALVVSDTPAAVAGAFTTNVMKAPPVSWNADICANQGTARAIFLNSGNANAATGDQGMADVRTTAHQVGLGLGVDDDEVCICSTGVIGVPLPMDRIGEGVTRCIEALSPDGSRDAAVAIMTTDTVPKEMAVEIDTSAGPIRIGAIAKGAGMIAPNMATMFCILTTDADLECGPLADLVRSAVAVSFNRICIDNDMSTSDTVLCLANGQSGAQPFTPVSADYEAFTQAFTHVCQEMSKQLVRDGEGASKFVEIEVTGAATDDDAKTIARAVAHSQLCKTAFFGQDPNWGRFACAAGYAGVDFDPNALAIWLDDVKLTEGGLVTAYKESDAAAVMQRDEFRVRIAIGEGPGAATFWTSDLSHDYVAINADYRT